MPIQDMNTHSANRIGGNNIGGLHGVAYLKSELDALVPLSLSLLISDRQHRSHP
jgi:hypothetical protein